MTWIRNSEANAFTRCVEAGVGFSFRAAFCDLSSRSGLKLGRPFRTWVHATSGPNAKALGYFRLSLRDKTGPHDNFLGYMAGVLPLLKAGQKGFDPL